MKCKHRGSQRRSTCCLGKNVNRWICTAQKAPDGFSPMDCVKTVEDFEAQRELAPSAYYDEWPDRVKICDNCPLYEAINTSPD